MFYLTKNRNFIKMHTTLIRPQNQTINPDKPGVFGDYFSMLKIESMFNKSGIIKTS